MNSRNPSAAIKERYARIQQARAVRHARILFTRSEASPEKTIAVRFAIILASFALVVVIFWLDRDGLQDAHDG